MRRKWRKMGGGGDERGDDVSGGGCSGGAGEGGGYNISMISFPCKLHLPLARIFFKVLYPACFLYTMHTRPSLVP